MRLRCDYPPPSADAAWKFGTSMEQFSTESTSCAGQVGSHRRSHRTAGGSRVEWSSCCALVAGSTTAVRPRCGSPARSQHRASVTWSTPEHLRGAPSIFGAELEDAKDTGWSLWPCRWSGRNACRWDGGSGISCLRERDRLQHLRPGVRDQAEAHPSRQQREPQPPTLENFPHDPVRCHSRASRL